MVVPMVSILMKLPVLFTVPPVEIYEFVKGAGVFVGLQDTCEFVVKGADAQECSGYVLALDAGRTLLIAAIFALGLSMVARKGRMGVSLIAAMATVAGSLIILGPVANTAREARDAPFEFDLGAAPIALLLASLLSLFSGILDVILVFKSR